MSEPLVSVTVCTFNAEKYVQRAINSIQEQTYRNIEIVVVDDGSTDRTLEILLKMQSLDQRISVFPRDHKGLAAARTLAFDRCRGDWIAIIDADDFCYPTRIEEQLKWALSHPQAGFVFCNTDYINEDGTIVGQHLSRFTLPQYMNKSVAANLLLQKGCFVDTESVFIHRDIYQKCRPFDSSLRYACDYDFFVRVGLHTDFTFISKSLAAWRIHSSQMTNYYSVATKDFEEIRIFAKYFLNPQITITTRTVISAKLLRRALRGTISLMLAFIAQK